MKNEQLMEMTVKRIISKKTKMMYFVAMDAYNKPSKIIDIVSIENGKHYKVEQETERRLLQKFKKVTNKNRSCEEMIETFLEESIIKHPIITVVTGAVVACAYMGLAPM